MSLASTIDFHSWHFRNDHVWLILPSWLQPCVTSDFSYIWIAYWTPDSQWLFHKMFPQMLHKGHGYMMFFFNLDIDYSKLNNSELKYSPSGLHGNSNFKWTVTWTCWIAFIQFHLRSGDREGFWLDGGRRDVFMSTGRKTPVAASFLFVYTVTWKTT